MVFESWGKGQLPAWNPYELAGTPLLANSQSGAFYPPHIVLGLLHVPTALAIVVLAWVHLFWAGLGAYVLTRKLGGSKVGATLAGAAFSLSPFMLAWTPLPSVITTVSWIPWILAMIAALFGESAPNSKRPNSYLLRTTAGLAACTAMMVLGGHLQFCAYGFMAATLMALWLGVERALRERDRALAAVRRAACAFIGLALGAMLAAPQLLPVLSYAKFSHRANVASAKGYEAYVGGAIPSYALQGIAFPTALGNPATPMQGGFKDENGYWPALTSPGSDFAETALGVGPVVFLLLCFVRKPKRGGAALVALGAIALLVAFGTAVNMPLYFLVPGWSASGSPGRIAVLFVLSACVVGGLAVENIGFGGSGRFRAVAFLAGLVALLAATSPVVLDVRYPSPYGIPVDKLGSIIENAVTAQFPVFAVALVIAWAALIGARAAPRFRLGLPVAAVICALFAYGWNLLPTGTPLPSMASDPTARYAFVNRSSSWPLIGGAPHVLAPPNTAAASRVHEIAGYDSLLHRDSVAMLRAIDGEDPAPPANGNMMFVKERADPRGLAEAGVTQVWSLEALPQFGNQPSTGGLFRYTLHGPGRIVGDGARIEAEDYRTLTVSATGPGPLTVKDRMMPGWTATVDGAPTEVHAVDSPLGRGLWRGLDLPAGNHRIVFRYTPPGLSTGLWIAGFALLVCLGLLFGRGKRRG